jgi:hypothetical protein
MQPDCGGVASRGQECPAGELRQPGGGLRRRGAGRAAMRPARVAPYGGPFLPAWAHVLIVTLLLAAALAVLSGGPAGGRILRGENDFLPQYAGARLVFTRDLYVPEAVRMAQIHASGRNLLGQWYSRLPFYAVLLRPLALAPYQRAYLIFQCLNLACFVFFIRYYLLPRHPRYVAWTPVFFPLLLSLANGQDVTIVLLFCALFLLLADRGHDRAAGACLSLCLIKFHLFLFVPLAILAHRRWRILLGAAAGSALWLAVSFAAAGWDWPGRYLALLTRPELHPKQATMPTVLGVLRSFAWPPALVALAMLATAAFFIAVLLRARRFEASVALALVAGIVLAFHAYPQDCVLLLISIPVLAGRSAGSLAPGIALMTPLPYFAALSGRPWSLVLPALMIALAAAAVRNFARAPRSRRLAQPVHGAGVDPVRAAAGDGA